MALTNKEIFDIELPLSDEDYLKLRNGLKESHISLSYNNPELWIEFNKKVSEIYDARHPNNNLSWHEKPWEPPLTAEEKDKIAKQNEGIDSQKLIKEELQKITLPLSDDDYVKILFKMDDYQFSLSSISEKLDLAFEAKAAEYYDFRHSGNNLWHEEIPWEMPVTVQEKIDIRTRDFLWTIRLQIADKDYIKMHEMLEASSLSLGQEFPDLELAYKRKMVDIYDARHPGNRISWDEIPWEPPLTDEEKAVLETNGVTIEINKDEDSNNELSYMGMEGKKSEDREELERIAFELVKEGDGIDRGQWAHDLIKCYPHEVIDAFGSDPFEVTGLLEDMWDTDDYEDPESGLTMSWGDWAAFFCNDVTKRVYSYFVDEHKKRSYYEEEKRNGCGIN